VPGPWAQVVKQIRALPLAERRSLSEDVSRVSRKLHQRARRRTIQVQTGYLAEATFAVVGAIVLRVGVTHQSNLLVILAALIWTVAFEPLVKVGVGHLLGIGYEYAYLYGVEPRFKMRFGDYIAQPRYARLSLHLSGMIGSPIGACLPTLFVDPSMRIATYLCWAVFWMLVAIPLMENDFTVLRYLVGTNPIFPHMRAETVRVGSSSRYWSSVPVA